MKVKKQFSADEVRPPKRPFKLPHWSDAELIERMAASMRMGCSEVAVALREGLSERVIAAWLVQWRDELGRLIEAHAEGKNVEPSPMFDAVTPLARARGEWLCDAEVKALNGDPGAMWALPRRCSAMWGTKDHVTVDAGPSPDKEVAAALRKLRGE